MEAGTVFALGEALHRCGVGWYSGPVALFEAGYLAELVSFLAALARPIEYDRGIKIKGDDPPCLEQCRPHAGRSAMLALLLAALSDVTADPLHAIKTGLPKSARPELDDLEKIYDRDAFVDAWEAREAVVLEDDLQNARSLAASRLPAAKREEDVLTSLVAWVDRCWPHVLKQHRYLDALTTQRHNAAVARLFRAGNDPEAIANARRLAIAASEHGDQSVTIRSENGHHGTEQAGPPSPETLTESSALEAS